MRGGVFAARGPAVVLALIALAGGPLYASGKVDGSGRWPLVGPAAASPAPEGGGGDPGSATPAPAAVPPTGSPDAPAAPATPASPAAPATPAPAAVPPAGSPNAPVASPRDPDQAAGEPEPETPPGVPDLLKNFPEPPARNPPALPEGPAVFSRVVQAAPGQYVEIPFRGSGWVFLGEADSRRGFVYDSRRSEPDGMCFIFRAEAEGEYALNFYRQDFLRGYILNDHVRVVVTGARGQGADRVVATPRWPAVENEVPADGEGAGGAAGTGGSTGAAGVGAGAGGAGSAVDARAGAGAAAGSVAGAGAGVGAAGAGGAGSAVDTRAAGVGAAGSVAGAGAGAGGAGSAVDARAGAGAGAGAGGAGSAVDARAGVGAAAAAGVPAAGAPPAGAARGGVSTGTPPAAGGAAGYAALEDYVREARREHEAGRNAEALAALDRLVRDYPAGTDEAFWLRGQVLETAGPTRDIKGALDCYRRLTTEYPQSPRAADARQRIAYLERHYLNIR